MNTITKSFTNIFCLLSLLLILGIGCAKDNKKSSTPVAPAPNCTYPGQCPGAVAPGGYQYGANACQGGMVYTSYGCLPTGGACGAQGIYQNPQIPNSPQQCIPPLTIGPNGMPSGMGNYNGSYGFQYGYSQQYPYGGYNGYGYNYNPYSYSSYPYYTNPYFNFYLRF